MKISFNWLKEYLPLEMPVGEVADILTRLGLEASGIETVESIRGGLKGVVAGNVLTCEKHPNADRLSLTTVDIGSDSPLQIVCGAPNVAADQKVWVATVGSVLYPVDATEPVNIARVKVRGETSEGMICAADELGLGDDHSGIMVLPSSIMPGTFAADYYNVTADSIIEVDLTPNRSDAICHLGIAKDLAAFLAIHGDGTHVRFPQIPSDLHVTADRKIDVEVLNGEACPRYCGVTITGTSISESPDWLKQRLRSVGVKPINNIVDVTNFILHEMGQPLHAFDADKIGSQKVVVKTLPEDTLFVALDSTQYKLSDRDLVICDGDSRGMCIAGVYGGLGSGITDKTTNVFLESAHFNARWIRQTSTRHDLRTDAARTFEKSTDPSICRDALIRAVTMILDIAGGDVASSVIDIYPEKIKPAQVKVRWKAVSDLTGADVSREEIRQILKALDMTVVDESSEHITVAVPTNKADVTREADVIEEFLRVYGYDRIEIPHKLEISLNPAARHSLSGLREEIGDLLAGQGFIEMMGLSLIESRNYNEGPLSLPADEGILIENTSNIHLNLMRHNLLASAMEAVRFNQNRMQNDLMLFEFGRTYHRSGSSILEREHLVLCLTGKLSGGWRYADREMDFFQIKKYVQMLLVYLGISDLETGEIAEGQWEYGLSYHAGGKKLVELGKVSEEVTGTYDLRQDLYFADFDLEVLLDSSAERNIIVSEISKYPAVQRDLALVVSKEVTYRRVRETILSLGLRNLTELELFDVYESDDVLGPDKRSLAVSMTFLDPERTLTDEEVSGSIEKIVGTLRKETGAVLR